MLFVKVNTGVYTSWFELFQNRTRIANVLGGQQDLCGEVLEEREAEDWSQLDWSGTYLDKPDSEEGWLTPDGRYYGFDYGSHGIAASVLFDKRGDELLEAGYGKCHGKSVMGDKFCVFWVAKNDSPTEAQRAWLKAHHYKGYDEA